MSHFDLTIKVLEADPVGSKSVSNEGHFTLEDVKVFPTYLPLHISRVTDTLHFDLPTKTLHTLRVCTNSVSNEGHLLFRT
jgi:hypothetical protein